MDSLASDDSDFKDYVESVLGSDNCKACQAVCYGVSKSGVRFALVLVNNLYHYVYMVLEPSGEDIRIEPVVPYASFNDTKSAIAYMKVKDSELKSGQKKGDLTHFNNFVMEKLKPIWGREVYRIHDFDTQGNPFVIVLKKWFIYYRVVIFTNQTDQSRIKSIMSREGAEKYLQNERNKLKGIDETYSLFYRQVVAEKWLNFDENIPESVEEMQNLTDNNYISDTIIKDKPDFAAFVEKSVLSSFRGEEVYRKYGVTHAGQHFCFIVSKIDYYIVHVVLEPSTPYLCGDEIKNIKLFSRTWLLQKVRERAIIDKFVAREIKRFIDKSETSLLFKSMKMMLLRKSFPITNKKDLVIVQNFLRRGDHLRRNLNVGILSPTYHDGIYLGNGKVAHYTTDNSAGFFGSKGGSGPGIVSLETFLHGETTLTVQYRMFLSRSGEQVAQVAEFLIRNRFWDRSYNLLKRNCQLFADLCTITTAEYIRVRGGDVEDLKTSTKLIFKMTLFWAGFTGFAWYEYCAQGLNAAFDTITITGLFSLSTISGAITFTIYGGVWWFQNKTFEKTLQTFTELENRMA